MGRVTAAVAYLVTAAEDGEANLNLLHLIGATLRAITSPFAMLAD